MLKSTKVVVGGVTREPGKIPPDNTTGVVGDEAQIVTNPKVSASHDSEIHGRWWAVRKYPHGKA